jgi:hypothetical protein
VYPEQVDQLVTALHQAAGRLTGSSRVGRDVETTLGEIVAGAVATIPGVTYAGITVLESGGRLTSTAPTGEVVARLDQAQAVLREGPCVSALAALLETDDVAVTEAATEHDRGVDRGADGRDDSTSARTSVLVDDLATETQLGGRWPRFAPEALRNGIVSLLSIPLSERQRPLRALNLYSDRPAVFDSATRTLAVLFADQATIALYGAEHAAALNRAVATRDVIGQAKGILIERHHLASGDDAFAMLVEASQHTNIKLRDVAEWLVTDTTAGAGREGRRPRPLGVDDPTAKSS